MSCSDGVMIWMRESLLFLLHGHDGSADLQHTRAADGWQAVPPSCVLFPYEDRVLWCSAPPREPSRPVTLPIAYPRVHQEALFPSRPSSPAIEHGENESEQKQDTECDADSNSRNSSM